MKNVTLSVPDEILRKAREYAKNHGTTLNELIRTLLSKTINEKKSDFLDQIENSLDKYGVDTKALNYKREDLYER
ncbi:MAG: DUF6364 family protein [Cyclobacteriaceae bacterium]